MADDRVRSRALTEKRRALLEKILRDEQIDAASPSAVPRRPAGETPQLSFAQERLWFLDRFQPNSPAYNVPAVFPLTGPIHVDALRQSLQDIVQRHEILRTTFGVQGTRPVQIVAPVLHLNLTEIDLQGLPDSERAVELQRRIAEETQATFDLTRGPLVRTTLIHLGTQEHYFLVTMHHIVTDAWSMEVFYRELATFYEAHSTGKRADLPELPIQYGDFAKWQRDRLKGQVMENLLLYWTKKLSGAPGVIELPTDRPRPAARRFHGGALSFVLPASLAIPLKGVAQQENATLFMVMLAAFKALLFRYTGREDVVVGTPVASRDRMEVEGLIGLFLNTLVLRTDLSGEPSFRQLVRRVREVCLEAFQHQDLPFERLVEELQPERNLNVPPLFQVLFVLQSLPQPVPGTPDSSNSAESFAEAQVTTSKFDLSLYLVDTGQTIQGTWEYDRDLFDAPTIVRMARHLQILLEGAVKEPDRPVSRLPILTGEEKELFEKWNASEVDNHPEVLPHELFESQVRATPDANAVVFGSQLWTYRELNQRANQLARHLRKLGVGPEVPVGICVERSVEMIWGVLGILKAGGVHMPLDAAYPKDRLTFMLSDAKAPVLLTQKRLEPLLPKNESKIILLDADERDAESLDAESGENLGSMGSPHNLAYVIYTSGSTGRPKGVGMSLRTLSNLTQWQNSISPLSAGERTLQFTSFSFDVSVLEILSTLSSAGTLVIMPGEIRADMKALLNLLSAQRVHRLFMPFTALQRLAEEAGSVENLALHLKQVISTGEALHITQPVAAFFLRLKGCTLHNEYGPTETHFVTEFTLPQEDPGNWPRLPSIGRCIHNAKVYILDKKLERVPIGVVGELYAGGVVVARGYLGRPAMTAEKFLNDPFSGTPGATMYRTGDLARFGPDGNIEFLGRSDHQIKIRGFRIEPGEVEVVLSKHPAIQEAAVVAQRSSEKGDPRLVAYVVAKNPAVSPVSGLRRFLLEQLPDYMVPSAYVALDRLPLGATGKVDRLRLPQPEAARPVLEGAFVAPRSPLEEQVAQIWAEVLAIDKVGIEDDFFELGGHSLLVVQIMNRIREVLSVDVPLLSLFESPTVAGLAQAIVAAQVQQSDRQDVAEIMAELESLGPEELQHLLSETEREHEHE